MIDLDPTRLTEAQLKTLARGIEYLGLVDRPAPRRVWLSSGQWVHLEWMMGPYLVHVMIDEQGLASSDVKTQGSIEDVGLVAGLMLFVAQLSEAFLG